MKKKDNIESKKEEISLEEYAKKLTDRVLDNEDKNNDEHNKMTARIEVLEEKVDRQEEQIVLTRKQQKMVQANLKDRVKKLCREYGLTPNIHQGMVRALLYSAIYEKFDVTSYMDIPREKYEDVLDYINHQPIDCSSVRRRYEDKKANDALATEKGLARKGKKIINIR